MPKPMNDHPFGNIGASKSCFNGMGKRWKTEQGLLVTVPSPGPRGAIVPSSNSTGRAGETGSISLVQLCCLGSSRSKR